MKNKIYLAVSVLVIAGAFIAVTAAAPDNTVPASATVQDTSDTAASAPVSTEPTVPTEPTDPVVASQPAPVTDASDQPTDPQIPEEGILSHVSDPYVIPENGGTPNATFTMNGDE